MVRFSVPGCTCFSFLLPASGMGGIKLPFPPADPQKGHPAAEKTMVNATARRHGATLAMDFCGVSQSLLNKGASCKCIPRRHTGVKSMSCCPVFRKYAVSSDITDMQPQEFRYIVKW